MIDSLSDREIERRTKLAKLRQLELNVEKDALALEDKKGNLCRIDLALSEFDAFLKDFVQMMLQFPDIVQKMVPSTNPDEYRALQNFIDETIQRLGERRLHLAIESTSEERRLVCESVHESQRKNVKLRKDTK
jgi:hypothetical protein